MMEQINQKSLGSHEINANQSVFEPIAAFSMVCLALLIVSEKTPRSEPVVFSCLFLALTTWALNRKQLSDRPFITGAQTFLAITLAFGAVYL
jgi:hypothetical protein